MAVCQRRLQRNSGPILELGGRTGLTLARKRIAERFVEAVLWINRWGPMATAASRIRELEQRLQTIRPWTDQGVWAQMHQHCCDDADLEYLIIDSTVVRAHPCAAGVPQKGWPGGPGPGPEPRRVQHQDSRERRRLGQPLAIHPDRGATARHHPGEEFRRLCWRARTGRPRVRCPGVSPAHPGTGYDTGHSAPSNRKAPADYDRHLYRERHLVECFISKIKHYRRIFSRFEKLDTRYLGFLHFTAALIWLR